MQCSVLQKDITMLHERGKQEFHGVDKILLQTKVKKIFSLPKWCLEKWKLTLPNGLVFASLMAKKSIPPWQSIKTFFYRRMNSYLRADPRFPQCHFVAILHT